MQNGIRSYHLLTTDSMPFPQLMTCRVQSSSSMVDTHWKVALDNLEKMGIYMNILFIRYLGDDKGLILFTELCKLWLAHAKALQENIQLKTVKVEKHKHFKAHDLKIGQTIAVKNHLRKKF